MVRLRLRYTSVPGFTLIELVVVVAILAMLVVISLATLDPSGDFQKADDAVRKLDIEHIQAALDTYYQDNNCYPQTIPFGGIWTENGVVYMQKVPQDPDSAASGWAYQYQTDTTNTCPQWNALYAHLLKPPKDKRTTCPILNACGYMQTAYSYCVFSGSIDCSYIKSNKLVTPTPTPTSGPTPTSSPTPLPGGSCSCADAQYDIRGVGQCNLVMSGANYCDAGCSIPCTP